LHEDIVEQLRAAFMLRTWTNKQQAMVGPVCDNLQRGDDGYYTCKEVNVEECLSRLAEAFVEHYDN
jgi:hypothetical protein